MIPKPGKHPRQVISYQTIRLLPQFGKIFKSFACKNQPNYKGIESNSDQFKYLNRHPIIEQVNLPHKCDTLKKYCCSEFLNATDNVKCIMYRLFDKVWHDHSKSKIVKHVPIRPYLLYVGFLPGRQISYVKCKEEQTGSNSDLSGNI